MSASHEPIRVLLYSHDSLGLGHIRRNLSLAHALVDHLPELTGRPVTGLLMTGVGAVQPAELPEGFDVVVLPGVRKGSGGYRPRHVQVPMSDLLDVRGRMLNAAVTGFQPDLVIVDRHAYGVDGELRRALTKLRKDRPAARIVLGLREVLDSPAVAAKEWAKLGSITQLRSLFDAIWVYGDPEAHDARATGEIPAGLHDLVQFTGYLSRGRYRGTGQAAPVQAPYILTTVGGGSDGMALCRAAAQAPVPAGYRHLVVTGPQMAAAAREEIAGQAGPATTVVATIDDSVAAMRGASAVVSMAGYNTVCEVMDTDIPALLVPREEPRMEQSIRARGLAAQGAFDTVSPTELTPDRLGTWIAAAVDRVQDRSGLDRHGLQQVPGIAAALLTPPALAAGDEPAARSLRVAADPAPARRPNTPHRFTQEVPLVAR